MPKTWGKPDLVEAIADKTGLDKKTSAAALDALLETITQALKNHDRVQLVGFGTFSTRERGERKARDIRTGEEITVPAATVPVFKFGRPLKEAVK